MWYYVLCKLPNLRSIVFTQAERIDKSMPIVPRLYNFFTDKPTRIGRIYIGNIRNSEDLQWLTDHKITTIVNCTADQPNYYPDQFVYKRIEIHDQRDDFLDASELMKMGRYIANHKEQRFLIHCFEGTSRSCAVVCAYLMSSYGWDWKKSYDYVKSNRPVINMNKNFIEALSK